MYLVNSLAIIVVININNIFELTYYKYYKQLLIRNVTTWYSLFLNQPACQENKFYNFKIYLFSVLNTKQTNGGIFSNMAGENFNLEKIFLNVRVRLQG